jgi:hypothetical protein
MLPKNKNRVLNMEQDKRRAIYRMCHEESTTTPEIFLTLIYIAISQTHLYPMSNAYGGVKRENWGLLAILCTAYV